MSSDHHMPCIPSQPFNLNYSIECLRRRSSSVINGNSVQNYKCTVFYNKLSAMFYIANVNRPKYVYIFLKIRL